MTLPAEYTADHEFRPWPKLARLHRNVIITEKIDGTNACIIVGADDTVNGRVWVGAQSRNKVLGYTKQERDSFGFAHWVSQNTDALAELLGPGYHYGEWYGKGIQRGYGLDEKRFALFNTRYAEHEYIGKTPAALRDLGIDTVPILTTGNAQCLTAMVNNAVTMLSTTGSVLVPGFMKPEGVVIYHTHAHTGFKVTLEKDEQPKGIANA